MTEAIKDNEDLDPLVLETLAFLDDADLQAHIASTLPNKGEDLEHICARGLEQLERNCDALSQSLKSR